MTLETHPNCSVKLAPLLQIKFFPLQNFTSHQAKALHQANKNKITFSYNF